MSYSPQTRDRYRLAVAAITGLTTFGALTASGLIAGAAASDYEGQQAQKEAKQQAEQLAWKQANRERNAIIKANKQYAATLAKNAAHPKIVLRDRPLITNVTTQYLQGGSSSVGSGGSVSPYTGGSTSGGSSGGSSGGGGGTPAPPPPPPPPPPAPSSGS